MGTGIIVISTNDLKNLLGQVLSEYHLSQTGKTLSPNEPTVYATREEVAKILRISLPTLGSLTKNGDLKAYKVGRNVRYKLHEVEKCFDAIATSKYKRGR